MSKKRKIKKKAKAFRIYGSTVAKVIASLAALILSIAELVKALN